MAGSRDDELAQTATAPGASGEAPEPAAEPLGATLGRYRLERLLGEGGMGTVHAAFDPDLERRVALKVLRGARSDDQARQRLLREARAMARLTHTNVVTVHEVGSAGGRDYVAMELVDGEERGKAAQIKLDLDPGKHDVTVKPANGSSRPQTQHIQLVAGQDKTVTFNVPVPPSRPTPPSHGVQKKDPKPVPTGDELLTPKSHH